MATLPAMMLFEIVKPPPTPPTNAGSGLATLLLVTVQLIRVPLPRMPPTLFPVADVELLPEIVEFTKLKVIPVVWMPPAVLTPAAEFPEIVELTMERLKAEEEIPPPNAVVLFPETEQPTSVTFVAEAIWMPPPSV